MYIHNGQYREDLEAALTAVPDYKRLYGKTFLITGATGLIASFLIDLLMYANETRRAKIKIYALGRSREKLNRRYVSFLDKEELKFIVQDICEPLIFDEHADYIVHAAGNGYPAAFRVDPVGTMTPALFGTYHLLEYARNHTVEKMLYVSSGEVYGEVGKQDAVGKREVDCKQDRGFTETDNGKIDFMSARACYPTAKRAAETLCASYLAQYQVQSVVARLSHTYGANTTSYDNRASAQFLTEAAKGKDIILKSAGTQKRSYTYVADTVSGILTTLLHGQAGEAYNIANKESVVTIAQFAEKTAKEAGIRCLFENPDMQDQAEKTPISYAVLDASRLEALGWKGRYSPEQGIAHTLAVLREIKEQV